MTPREKLRAALAAEGEAFGAYCEACDALKDLGDQATREHYQRRGEAQGRWDGEKLNVVNAARSFEVELSIQERGSR